MLATTTPEGRNGHAVPRPTDARPVACYPLSALQEGMLFHYLMDPGGGTDVEQYVFAFAHPPDVERLREAWQRVTDRYDVLRTAFRWDAERPLQEVWAHVTVPFAVDDRPDVEPAERERALEAAIEKERAGLGLAPAPVQRLRLIRWSETAATLIWTNHHAILDGRARAIVLRDVVDAYAGRPLKATGVQYGAQIGWLESRDVAASEPFWRAYLRGIAAPSVLPVASGVDAGKRPVVVSRVLAGAATAPFAELARATGLSVNVFVQAAWALLLARHASNPDVLFGTVRACRHSGAEGSNGIVGLLINTLPLRIGVDENATLVAWLRHVRTQWDALRDVEHTPLRTAAACSEIPPGSPLFESLVMYERDTFERTLRTKIDPDDELGVAGIRLIDQTGFPLTLAIFGSEEMTFRLAVNPRRYSRPDAERILEQFLTVLCALPRHAGGYVRDISLITPDEMRRVLGFNTTSDYPREATVPELFAEQVRRAPGAIAARLGAATLSYRELDSRSDAVAAHLHALGIGRGGYVGVCVERSFEMLAALLGILKAGAISIAVDPAHPAARVAFLLRDAGATVVLAQAHLIGVLAPALAELESVRAVALETLPAAGPAPRVVLGPDDGAHVMYTSGSTGTPKGAVIPHRAIVRTVRGAEYLRFAADETFFAFVPLTFDVAVLELWGPLLNGARLVLCPPELPSLDELGGVVEAQGVTTLWLTTALFEQMVDEQLPRLRGLRQLIVGGDVMSPAHARRLLAAVPGIRLLNVCGPTEATVLIVAHHLRTPPTGPIPLGKPIANATVYVLDAEQRPVPVGVPGEIYTGGDGVALGYLNRPELTAERFLPDPFIGRPNATMYRTGDLARWNADGEIEFLGRIDNQIKIRGIRVELGEIESTLTDHPGVREAVVVAVPVGSAEKQLIAYIIPRDPRPPAVTELQSFLHTRLPTQMVPPFFVFLDALPRTPTGKFDRKALPDPGALLVAPAEPARRAPASDVEITVAGSVAEILEIDDIGLDDDVYALGCDSLRAMRLVSRLREVFNVDLTVRDLVAAPTVGGLTGALVALARKPAEASMSNVSALRTPGTQAPLFFLHGDLIGGGYYCRELARVLGEDRPFYVVAPHGVATEMPWSIEAMARDNVAAIRALQPAGPIALGGFCNGGIVAYEMARQLERAGVPVEDVVLIDTFNRSGERKPLRTRLRQEVRWALERCGLRRPVHLRSASTVATKWQDWHERLLVRWLQILGRYVPGLYRGKVSLLWTDESAPQADHFTAQWRRVAPAAGAGRIPGTHQTTMTRHLAETSRILADHFRGAVS